MNRILGLVFFSLICSQQGYSQFYEVDLIQGKKIIKIKDTLLVLKKAPFALRFHILDTLACHFVHASLDSLYYDKARKKEFIKEFEYSGIGLAESSPPDDSLIYLEEEFGVHCWYYENDSSNRFHVIRPAKQGVYALRMVSSVWMSTPSSKPWSESKSRGVIVPIQKLHKDLFLIFFTSAQPYNYSNSKKTNFKTLHIKWE